eukprot:gene5343-6486_t
MTATGVTTVGVKALMGVKESLLAMLKRITIYFRTDFSVHAQLDSPCLLTVFEAYIIMDYMNKWLPFKHRATTSDAFGQAGESVHGATIYVRVLPEQATEVISNACYHGTLYWLLVSIMENVTGIKTTGVGMNESGEGKDESDSSFNTVKAYVRRLVHLGSLDAKTTADFVGALNSGEGMVGMIARVVEILRPTVSVDDTLDQITRFSHFRHEGTWLRCWEQYDIGPGRLFSREELQKLLKEALPETTGE